jgi:acyl-CoA reductase-like NAD-dependent aldehyde dehydrogenase
MAIDGLTKNQVEEIVSKVVSRLAPALGHAAGGVGPVTNPKATPSSGADCAPAPPNIARGPSIHRGRRGIFDDVDSAVAAARIAHETIVHNLSLEDRGRIIAAMRKSMHDHVHELSQWAVEETGLGRYEDKIHKNLLCADKTPGVEIRKPWAQTGDNGLVLMERAPFGVIGAITPCTNPTETIICNSIGMVAGGNSAVFNVHPSAKKVCRAYVEWMNEAIVSAGGPENLITMIGEPTIESAGQVMTHPGTRIVVVTGGPAVVKAAMNSGKRAICGGPGNPPVVVDETADIRKAAVGIVAGHSLDNNIVCIAEKEVIAVADVADLLKRELAQAGAAIMSSAEISKLEGVVLAKGHTNKEWVGKDASKIAAAIGKNVPAETRTLVCEVDSEDHPFIQEELLMPVLALTRAPDVDQAIDMAVRVEHGFGHTSGMYSTNVDNMHNMARACDTSIFVKNAPHYAGLGLGGEGYTSFTIASPTGEGLTTALSFTRERRCTLKENFRIV